MIKGPLLIVFGGLPGTGKTTLARLLAAHTGGVYLRIDTIEKVLRRAGGLKTGEEGYLVAYEIAADNLKAGNIVIADCVNSVMETRRAWKRIGTGRKAKIINIEIICSDRDEHRRRVEKRKPEPDDDKIITWKNVINRKYQPWKDASFVIDTAGLSEKDCFQMLTRKLSEAI